MPTKTVALTVEAQISTAYVSKTTTVTSAAFLWKTASVSKQVFAMNATCRMRIASATCAKTVIFHTKSAAVARPAKTLMMTISKS